MLKKKIAIANWKMNKNISEAKKFADEIKEQISKNNPKSDIVICPPFTLLSVLKEKLNNSNVHLGAQNVHYEDKGAFTGEVSCSMLKDAGCEYVIIGHSERRQYFHETDEIINKKVLKVIENSMIPILCVGETLQEHQDKITEGVIEDQITKCLNGVQIYDMNNIIIAYEPVWAIGTGKNATPHQAETIHNFIRKKIKKLYDEETSKKVRIIYGGSVNTENAKELFASETINGGLIGGASLEVSSFTELIKAAS